MSGFKFDLRPDAGSATTDPPSKTDVYVCYGINNDEQVRSIALSYVPLIRNTAQGTLFRQGMSIDREGHKLYRVTVPYERKKNEDGSYDWNLTGTSGTINVKHAPAVARFPPDAADHGDLIGVNGKDVDGADIRESKAKLVLGFKHPQGFVSLAYAAKLVSKYNYVNSDPWLVWKPGEVLFVNSTAADGSDSAASVDYEFEIVSNQTGITVGHITGVAKDGHDYMSVTWEPSDDDGKATQKPLGVYTNRMYKRTSFASLFGFGGA